MKKDRLIFRSLRTPAFIRILTALLLIISSFSLTVSAVFLYSTLSFSNACRHHYRGTRTVVGYRRNGAAITQEDKDYLAGLPGAVSVFPEYQLTFLMPVVISPDSGSQKDVFASLMAADENCLPDGFRFKGYSYDEYALNGVILPDRLFSTKGRPIRSSSLIGSTIRVIIEQLDYYVDVPIDEAPPLIDTVYLDFTVMGVYNSVLNYSDENQIFMTPENIGKISDLFWNGFHDDSDPYFVAVLAESYEAAGRIVDTGWSNGFDLAIRSTLNDSGVFIVVAISSVIAVFAMLILILSISAIQKNNLQKIRDEINIMAATGFSDKQIRGYYLKPVLLKALCCHCAGAVPFLPFLRRLSIEFFGNSTSLRAPLLLMLTVMAAVLGTVLLAALRKLNTVLSGPLIISEEDL